MTPLKLRISALGVLLINSFLLLFYFIENEALPLGIILAMCLAWLAAVFICKDSWFSSDSAKRAFKWFLKLTFASSLVIVGIASGSFLIEREIGKRQAQSQMRKSWESDIYILLNHFDVWVSSLDYSKRRSLIALDGIFKDDQIQSAVISSIFGDRYQKLNSEGRAKLIKSFEALMGLPSSSSAEEFNKNLGRHLKNQQEFEIANKINKFTFVDLLTLPEEEIRSRSAVMVFDQIVKEQSSSKEDTH